MLSHKLGIVIIEALRLLREPASFKDIVAKVALLLKFPDSYVQEAVKKSLEGGVKHGFLTKKRDKYCSRKILTNLAQSTTDSSNNKKQFYKLQPTLQLDKKNSLVPNTSNVIRTIFKSQKRLRTSCEWSPEASSPCFNLKRRPNLRIEASIKSIPLHIQTNKSAKKFNVFYK